MHFKPFAIDKYEFVEMLGRGGMAEVYRVRLTGVKGFEKEFAIKRILPGFLTTPRVTQMFEDEARLTSILNHANIVHVFEFIQSSGNYFLVMEYIQGKNLVLVARELQKKKTELRQDMALYIINEVCKGLDYAHNKRDSKTGQILNIIHRDISPQNIMLSYEGGVKIVDFGIAKAMSNIHETKTGAASGKIAYMSPEQANGENIDTRSDIFSLSAVLYEVLLNKKLFDGTNELVVIRNVQACKIPSLETDLKTLPPELAQIVAKGLAQLPESRFQTISEMQEPIQKYLNTHYPEMNQRRFSDWLNGNCDLLSSIETENASEHIPLTESEKQLVVDGFSKLELAFLNESRPATDSISLVKEKTLANIPDLPTASESIPEQHPVPVEQEFKRRSPSSLVLLAGLVIIGGMVAKFALWEESKVSPVARKIAEVPPLEKPVEKPLEKVGIDIRSKKDNLVQPLSSPVAPMAALQVPSIVSEPVVEAPSQKIEEKPVPSRPRKIGLEKEISKVLEDLKRTTKDSSKATIEKSEAQKEFERLGASVEVGGGGNYSDAAKKLYEAGMSAYRGARYAEAAGNFHRSRSLKPSYLPSWFYEIMSLEALGKHEEAKDVAKLILQQRPETKSSPVLRPYLDQKSP